MARQISKPKTFNASTNYQLRRSLPQGVSLTGVVVLLFVVGIIGLAFLDQGFRPTFGELAKLVIVGFIGWSMPKG